MSESIRVRLEFKNFSNQELRNSLLSFKRSENKNVRSLQKLIKKRFHLNEDISLLIDGFVLEVLESIDVIRDNDLILIESKGNNSNNSSKKKIRVKTEPNIKTEDNVSNEDLISKYFNNKIKPKESDSTVSQNKEFIFDSKVKSLQNLDKGNKSVNTSDNLSEKTENLSTNDKICSKSEVTTLRDIPLRKAFQNATTSMKRKSENNVSHNRSVTTTKPKKRRLPKEATESVDRFSPIIILDRLNTIDDNNSQFNDSKVLKKNVMKQSARKSFPKPSLNKSSKNNNSVNNNNNNNNNIKTKENDEINDKVLPKGIDFENCEPLTTIPNIGDVIAFKILTLSSDGNDGYESSPFKMGSVLNVSESTQMVDILLHDVIKRNNLKILNKSDEQLFSIHSLKINWSTVLEPKVIERKTEEEVIIL